MDKDLIRRLPKTDLHVHLDGSLRLGTLVDLARERKVPLPSETPEGLEALVFRPRYANLNEYLEGFRYTVAVLQDEEALERTAFELAEDSQAEGVRYLEVRFAPQLHVRPGFDFSSVVRAVDRGLRRAADAFNAAFTKGFTGADNVYTKVAMVVPSSASVSRIAATSMWCSSCTMRLLSPSSRRVNARR